MKKITANERRWRFHRGAEHHRAMAKHSSHILEFARRGAQQRYDELVAEINSLVRHFPDLGAATTHSNLASAARCPRPLERRSRTRKRLVGRSRRRFFVRALSVRKAAFILRACSVLSLDHARLLVAQGCKEGAGGFAICRLRESALRAEVGDAESLPPLQLLANSLPKYSRCPD